MTLNGNLITQKEKSDILYSIITKSYKEPGNSTDIKQGEELFFTDFLFKRYCFEGDDINPIRFSTDDNVIIMQFCLHGECSYKSHKGKKLISFKNSEYNILFVPKGELNFISESQSLDFVNVYLEKEFFLRYIPESHILYKKKGIETFSAMSPTNFFISPQLKSVLNDIISCSFDGHLRGLYTKAKIIEILTLQLAQYEEEKNVEYGLKQAEIEKMMIVKDLIDSNLNESFSLAYLARVAGTNEQYLKKHFKILFGNTVFGYILSCKMQRAKEMLLSGEYRIADIAELTGYKHATHFTSAFKKFFGYLPQVLKSKGLMTSCLSFGEFQLFELLLF